VWRLRDKLDNSHGNPRRVRFALRPPTRLLLAARFPLRGLRDLHLPHHTRSLRSRPRARPRQTLRPPTGHRHPSRFARPRAMVRGERGSPAHHATTVMGTLEGFPNPPAMVRGERGSPAHHATTTATRTCRAERAARQKPRLSSDPHAPAPHTLRCRPSGRVTRPRPASPVQ
jgi:hypothetical protein